MANCSSELARLGQEMRGLCSGPRDNVSVGRGTYPYLRSWSGEKEVEVRLVSLVSLVVTTLAHGIVHPPAMAPCGAPPL